MNLPLTYFGIFVAAIVEGEIAYVAACALIAWEEGRFERFLYLKI